jgi:anti-sigma regulatory factor (Ser/Thr protein kinase)/predicted ArsR family transcriptional regulator
MDWFLDPPSPANVTRLRHQITRYLSRHAADKNRLWAAEIAVGELVGNAVDHTDGPVWVSLDWSEPQPVLTVHDLGPAFTFDPAPPAITAERGRGLWMVSQLSPDLAVAAKRDKGNRVSATLPVSLADQSPGAPPEEPPDGPPHPQISRREAPGLSLTHPGRDGLSRETFLQSIAVELILAVEESHGPAAAQAALARVGDRIGGQIEQEYRRTRQIGDRLSPAQIADCYAQMKTAIGGDFHQVEVTDDLIRLGNSQCPFGSTIWRRPTLCRLTSSIVGGIAARNTGGATITIDERIAFGDPECHISVHLGEQPGSVRGCARRDPPATAGRRSDQQAADCVQ